MRLLSLSCDFFPGNSFQGEIEAEKIFGGVRKEIEVVKRNEAGPLSGVLAQVPGAVESLLC